MERSKERSQDEGAHGMSVSPKMALVVWRSSSFVILHLPADPLSQSYILSATLAPTHTPHPFLCSFTLSPPTLHPK